MYQYNKYTIDFMTIYIFILHNIPRLAWDSYARRGPGGSMS
jgi:hypothetical protein